MPTDMIIFIPARKGSLRVKNKNTRLVCGTPLIIRTFQAITGALRFMELSFDNVLVSSDDIDVIKMAVEFGFKTAFRPDHLAGPATTMSDVLKHHVPDFDSHEAVMILYPTSPLRSSLHLISAFTRWKRNGGPDKTLMSVSPVYHRPFGLMRLGYKGFLKCLHPKGEAYYRTQDTPAAYRANGAIYIIPTEMIANGAVNTQLFCEKTMPFLMTETDGFEIDDEDDLVIAEALIRNRESHAESNPLETSEAVPLVGG